MCAAFQCLKVLNLFCISSEVQTKSVGKDYVEITVTQCKEANLIDSTSTTYSDLSTSLSESKVPSSLMPPSSVTLHLVSLLPLFFFFFFASPIHSLKSSQRDIFKT